MKPALLTLGKNDLHPPFNTTVLPSIQLGQEEGLCKPGIESSPKLR